MKRILFDSYAILKWIQMEPGFDWLRSNGYKKRESSNKNPAFLKPCERIAKEYGRLEFYAFLLQNGCDTY